MAQKLVPLLLNEADVEGEGAEGTGTGAFYLLTVRKGV